MKTIILCLALISLAVAQKPALQKDRQVLFDFRVDTTYPRRQDHAGNRTNGFIESIS